MPSTPGSARPLGKAAVLALLAIPFAYFLIPLLEGRAWNALSSFPFQILNPPDGYTGAIPQSPISAESWGASTVELPFRARLDYCVRNLELPLWNPYQGLGQPFAAQGEGCPYSPVAVLRSLLPYTWANLVTLGFYYVASAALYSFLRGMGLRRAASVLGGWGFVLSGALTLHLARNNLSDQVCMIPVLFWAAERSIRRATFSSLLTLACVACLHLLGGFVQIAMSTALVCGAFCLYYAWVRRAARSPWFPGCAATLLFFVLGNGLGSFSLLPQLEAMQASFSKNPEMLSMIPMPYANAVGMFFPAVFGKFFQSWIPGAYPRVIDWDNLFAFAGTGVAMLVVVGWSARSRWIREPDRLLFAFFSLTGVFLVLRYISFPPVAFVNMLPLIGRQSPKHANEITVFCFIVAAAFVIDSIRSLWSWRAHAGLAALVVCAASCVLTLVIRQGGWEAAHVEMARVPVAVTFVVVIAMWGMLAAAAGAQGEGGVWAVAVMIAAELALYVPMGTLSDEFLWARCALFCASIPVAMLVGRESPRSATAAFAIGLVFYAGFLVPRSNLPDNVDLTAMPTSVVWLKDHAGNHARSWGIQADLSSIPRIQDLGAVGPLAPFAYSDFIKAVADNDGYEFYRNSTMSLLGSYYASYPLWLYPAKKPIFDGVSLKYLYLPKELFGPGRRFDATALLRPPASMRVAYQDERVEILESKEAQPKLRFNARFLIEPDEQSILDRVRAFPAAMAGPPMLAATGPQVPAPALEDAPARVELVAYRPNSVRVRTWSDKPGLLTLDDAFAPGWHARIDGEGVPVLRVNGLLRGVFVPGGGMHEILFFYRPLGFVRGVGMSLLVLAYLGMGAFLAARGGTASAPSPCFAGTGFPDAADGPRAYAWIGFILAAGVFALIAMEYFHSS